MKDKSQIAAFRHRKPGNENREVSMRVTKIFAAAFFLLGLPLLGVDTYKIDPAHSEMSFKIRHLGLSKVSGRFTKFQGTIQVDEQDLSKSSVEVAIETASVNTDNDGRDKHLRSADFFDVEKIPAITFKSISVKEVSKGKLEVTGDFTMHGVTKRIVLPITSLGTAKSPFNDVRAGFEGNLTLNRGDYGIKSFPGVVGEEVDIALEIEAVKVEKK
jgi:polyisoprenoid-binding protein YceI